ncbi:MAG TPA: hypothetical protein VI818_05405 [Candidatus Thermoplasmatota archaeon]|nr:hypothetical protein [Candidatus Thermoplasmatota archaeon]
MRGLLVASLIAFSFAVAAFPTVVPENATAKLLILHDVRDDGYTYVGTPNQFAFVMITAEGATTVHKQGKITITQNGVKLYETQGGAGGFDTAHDYDAFNGFSFAFPTVGPYRVHAEIPNLVSADFNGYVAAVPNPVQAKVMIDGPTQASASAPTAFTVKIQDADGTAIPHTDALFEVRRTSDNFLLFRTHAHAHDDAMKLNYRFPEAGSYTVNVVGYIAYPEPAAPGFTPVTATRAVTVTGAAPPAAPAATAPSILVAPAAGPYVLLPTYDPDKVVGPFGNIRLNALVLTAENRTQASHVDFKATLTDPMGRTVFQSDTLHEYDGNLEVVTQNAVPGEYKLRVEAELDGWNGQTDLVFRVVPPSGVYGAGPILVDTPDLKALSAGTPSRLAFTMRTLAGTPHQHAEIDLQVLDAATGVPVLMNKLHTHMDGKFAIDYVFPTPGDYRLVLDAETVHADATPSYHYKQLGGKLVVPITVGTGALLLPGPPPVPVAKAKETGELPNIGLVAVLGALAAAVLVARRQL